MYVPTTAATHGITHCPCTTGSIHQEEATPHPNCQPATTDSHLIIAK